MECPNHPSFVRYDNNPWIQFRHFALHTKRKRDVKQTEIILKRTKAPRQWNKSSELLLGIQITTETDCLGKRRRNSNATRRYGISSTQETNPLLHTRERFGVDRGFDCSVESWSDKKEFNLLNTVLSFTVSERMVSVPVFGRKEWQMYHLLA